MLAACSGAPSPTTVSADDEALCRYAAGAADTTAYRHCRGRLVQAQAKQLLATATTVETPKPGLVALVHTPADVAACRGRDTNGCPTDGDITGTIPATMKKR
jgi:hypothetical protein